MHDTIWFEVQGKPAVFIATDVFRDAAEAQAKALGLPEVQRVFVPHPIQDATDEELYTKADAVLESILDALTSKHTESVTEDS